MFPAAADGLKGVCRHPQQQQQQLQPEELQQQVLSAVVACIQAQADALEQLKPAAAALQQQDMAARCVQVGKCRKRALHMSIRYLSDAHT
jgi:hypothetical protein